MSDESSGLFRRLGRWLRSDVLTAVALLLFAVTTVWFVIGLSHVWSYPAIGWLPVPVLAGLAALACLRVRLDPAVDLPIRHFWGRLGAGCAVEALAVLSNMHDALAGPELSPLLSTRTMALYGLIMIFILFALLRLPTWQRSRGDWLRFGLDSGSVLLTTAALLWHFWLRDLQVAGTAIESPLAMLCIFAGAAVSLITFVKVAFAGAGGLDRRALHLMSAGVALAAGSGLAAPLIADRPYLTITLLSSPLAAMTCVLAARQQRIGSRRPAVARPAGRRFSVLPYVAVAAMYAVLLAVELPQRDGGGELALAATALTVLVVLRQISTLRDNSRLLDTVDGNLNQLRAYQERLDHQISHDALTGIANRRLLTERLAGRLAAGEPVTVILLDLDDFKVVNDRHGHGTGDALLTAVSRRLQERIRPQDTVARLGGDEFILLLPGLAEANADALLRRLLAAVQEPLRVDGREMAPRVSVGVTASRPDDSPEELLRRADVAMYAAKTAGGGRWTWFDPKLDELADRDARLGADLRRAIERDELFLLYQPIVELPAGRLSGVEALVRWRHPEHGLVSPAVFIPLAERNGYIVELGRWVLERVVAQAAHWRREHRPDALEKVSVNVSARQLSEPGFAGEVAALLAASGLDPALLVVEVTETAVLGTGLALDTIRELNALGLRIALDDFGTGQSSLSLLVDCPVTVLKVDKSFVDGVTSQSPQAVIVDGLIGITEGLRIQAVAEGVETAEQADRLHRAGYRFAQGYHFARPMPESDIALLLDVAGHPSTRDTRQTQLN